MDTKPDLSRFFQHLRTLGNCKSCDANIDREELTERGLCNECEYYDTAGKIAEAYQKREVESCR